MNPETSVRFPYELDKFNPLDNSTIDDLDPEWAELSRQMFGETSESREKLTKSLEAEVQAAGLEDSVRILVGEGSLDLFYLKVLRAGGFTIERSMSVLTNFLDILVTRLDTLLITLT